MASLLGSIDYSAPLTAESLVGEVASGMFAFKNKIKAANIRLLWEKLGVYIGDTIRSQKGVLLPNLGNFKVGPVVGESKKKIRIVFTLLVGRYGRVSQERPMHMIGGKAPIVQPNYGLLSSGAVVHRAACQRLIAELLQRLGVHILSGRPIKCELPTVGTMVTNRSGRFEFVFNPLLTEYFEREHYALIKEMAYTSEDFKLAKEVQGMRLHAHSPQGRAQSASALRAAGVKDNLHHSPLKSSLAALRKNCRQADRIGSGCVMRLSLEKWLQEDCRSVLARLDAASVMDLMDRHAYGKTNKQIMYSTFIRALEDMVAPVTAFADDQPYHNPAYSPPQGYSPPQEYSPPHGISDGGAYPEDMEPDQESSVITPGQGRNQPHASVPQYNLPGVQQQEQQQHYLTQPHQQAPSPQHYPPPSPHFATPSSHHPPATPQYALPPPHHPLSSPQPTPSHPAASPLYNHQQHHHQQHHHQQQPPPSVPAPHPGHGAMHFGQHQLVDPYLSPPIPPSQPPYSPALQSAADPSRQDYLHYQQNLVSPRSRAEYDQFNRLHFEKLYKSRGPAPKRALTPKVGEEQLNEAEYQAVGEEQLNEAEYQAVRASPSERGHSPVNFLYRDMPHVQQQQGGPYSPYAQDAEVLRVIHRSSGGGAMSSPSQGEGPVHAKRHVGQSRVQYDILAPPPLPPSPFQAANAPVSQYDIAAEADPSRRARLREEYASQFRHGLEKQDKRPVSAMSRPPISPRRGKSPR
eukprot:gene13964-19904_t